MREMKSNPDMLFWFSKPEMAMNKRLNEHLGKQEQKEQQTRESIGILKGKYDLFTDTLQRKI